MSSRFRQYRLKWEAMGAGIFLAVFLLWIVVFGWGKNQALTVEYVAEHLHVGMNAREVEMGLGLPPGSVTDHLQKREKSQSYATVADSGLVGSFFVPQNMIAVVFDNDMRLASCDAEIHWRADEYRIPCHIGQSGKVSVSRLPDKRPADK